MSDSNVLQRVREALGHASGSVAPPAPPEIPDNVTRLVARDADLAAVFLKSAKDQKMLISRPARGEVVASVIGFLKEHPVRKVALASSDLLQRLGVEEAIRAEGFEVRNWDELTLDELYDFDCAITDVQGAVAENATLVIKPSSRHGRALSLVPMFHIAIVEPSQLMPDLIDLFEQLRNDTNRSNVILITGPSKTADIEMNVVTGVHGPNVVNVLLLA